MARNEKYDVSGLMEAQFEPGSGGHVLKNLLHIKSKKVMDQEEALALREVQEILFEKYDKGHRFEEILSETMSGAQGRGTSFRSVSKSTKR